MDKNERKNPWESIADILEKVDKYAGLVVAIIAALTFSQGNRLASYAFIVIAYGLLASFLRRVMTEQLEVGRKPRYPRPWRWGAAIALVVLTLLSVGWLGVNGWRDLRPVPPTPTSMPTSTPTPTPTPMPTSTPKPTPTLPSTPTPTLFPRAKQNELLVIVAQFDNRSTKGIDPTQRIHDRLREELKEAGITNVRLEVAPEISSIDEAREIGQRHNAIFVIWGWFDDIGFTPKFTIVEEQDGEEFALKGMQLEEMPIEPPRDFSLYIREGLPAQMAYFSTLTIGQVYVWDNKLNKALGAFDRAIENANSNDIHEGLAVVYLYRGYVHARKGDYDLATADFDEAIKREPRSAGSYYNRGLTYAYKKDYDLAIADFDEAIELKRDFAEAYNNLAIVYAHRGEYEQAINNFSKAIEGAGDQAIFYVNRGAVYSLQSHYDQAIADFDEAIELRPDLPQAYVQLAIVYIERNDNDQALTNLDKAVDVDSHHANAYFVRGVLYKEEGEKEKAVKDFEQFLELSDDEFLRRTAEEQLEDLQSQ